MADEIKKSANKKPTNQYSKKWWTRMRSFAALFDEWQKLIGTNAFNIIRGNNNKHTLGTKSESKNQCIWWDAVLIFGVRTAVILLWNLRNIAHDIANNHNIFKSAHECLTHRLTESERRWRERDQELQTANEMKWKCHGIDTIDNTAILQFWAWILAVRSCALQIGAVIAMLMLLCEGL